VGKRKKILVVEDDPGMRSLLEQYLTHGPFSVSVVTRLKLDSCESVFSYPI